MRIPASHPALDGHFPGHPVVPGVVILDAVAGALARHVGEPVQVAGFPVVKFLAVLQPDRDFEVVFADRRPGMVAFELVCGPTRIASGTVSFRRTGSGKSAP